MSAGKAQIGKPAPDFTAKAVMPDGQFKDLKLSDYRGTAWYYHTYIQKVVKTTDAKSSVSSAGKYVVFFFYPLDFTFVCPTEIIAFSDAAEEFKKINCEVIGVSVDSHFCHLAWWAVHSQFGFSWRIWIEQYLRSIVWRRLLRCIYRNIYHCVKFSSLSVCQDKHPQKARWPGTYESTFGGWHQTIHLSRLWCTEGGWRHRVQVWFELLTEL